MRSDLRARGLSSPEMYELHPSDADLYRQQMIALTKNNPFAASVYVYDQDEYDRMRMLVTEDGKAGVALKGDEVVSVFAHQDGAHPGVAQSMLRQATALGGHRLDCFDTVLPKLYADAGFVPIARLAWNDDYAPDGWNYQTYRRYNNGRPDVVFMAYNRGRWARAMNEVRGSTSPTTTMASPGPRRIRLLSRTEEDQRAPSRALTTAVRKRADELRT